MGIPDANVEHPQGTNQSPLSCALKSVSEATHMEELRSFTNLPNLVIVNFSAQWCAPCKFMKEKFAIMANQYADHSVIAVHVDIDKLPRCNPVYGVRTVPTFLLYRGGHKIAEVVGANEVMLRESIRQNL
ncbi:Cytoplasmic thioredoxin isoenzyme 2 [Orbilia blumenaviensis]|uniref:Cytoplasmic thioredoxin isoenzyme 2 n=1 Tax=Orbilia blumenaviensis TaxID=1796055 RepID=A0AAV9UMP1_9PEZI